MTNIIQLPQLSAVFTVATNGDWDDVIQFFQSNGTDPLDITGIAFKGALRLTAANPVVVLEVGTADGTLVNGGADGKLTWAVAAEKMKDLSPVPHVFDLIAIADGKQRNLFQLAGPARVNVNEGVTR
jgi:hypothetical protein